MIMLKFNLKIDDDPKARYKCKVCSYIYDPEKGDPRGNVKPGTPFSELPRNWHCPKCGAGVNRFVRIG